MRISSTLSHHNKREFGKFTCLEEHRSLPPVVINCKPLLKRLALARRRVPVYSRVLGHVRRVVQLEEAAVYGQWSLYV